MKALVQTALVFAFGLLASAVMAGETSYTTKNLADSGGAKVPRQVNVAKTDMSDSLNEKMQQRLSEAADAEAREAAEIQRQREQLRRLRSAESSRQPK